MKISLFRTLSLGAAALAVALAAVPAGAAETKFALLPLVAGDTGMPYAVLPTVAERAELGNRFEARVMAMNGGVALPATQVERALSKSGYDQNSAYKQCDDAACARKIGRSLHVDTVMFGSVTRALAMIWGSQVSLVDVATGVVRGPYDLGYKGDFITLSTGIDSLAQAVSTRMIADAAERHRARALAVSHR
ncbi:MAG: hypothetical protein NVSMB19_20680 [Vulcanimicrobiaceae bacterium]